MAIFYVKAGGTATGDGGRETVARTGTWNASTADYYDTLAEVFTVPTTGLAAGDFVYFSNASTSTSYGGSQTWTGPTDANPATFVSVSDTNQDQYATGAAETFQINFSPGGHMRFIGIDLTVNNDISPQNACAFEMNDATLTLAANGDIVMESGDAIHLKLTNCTFALGTNSEMRGRGACLFEMFGGSITGGGAWTLINSDAFNGGSCWRFSGVNMSSHTGTILSGAGADFSGDDLYESFFYNCQLGTGHTKWGEAFSSMNHNSEFIGCGETSAEAEYGYAVRRQSGEAVDDLQYRNESTAWPSGEKTTIKVTTNADCNIGAPFWFDMPARYAELSVASTDTARIYFTSTTALTDGNVWAEMIYQDGTNNHTPNFVSNRATDILGGTAHTTDSGSDWRTSADAALTGHNEYYMDLDTSGDAGADCVPLIRVYVGIASTDVFFDTTVDLVA